MLGADKCWIGINLLIIFLSLRASNSKRSLFVTLLPRRTLFGPRYTFCQSGVGLQISWQNGTNDFTSPHRCAPVVRRSPIGIPARAESWIHAFYITACGGAALINMWQLLMCFSISRGRKRIQSHFMMTTQFFTTFCLASLMWLEMPAKCLMPCLYSAQQIGCILMNCSAGWG